MPLPFFAHALFRISTLLSLSLRALLRLLLVVLFPTVCAAAPARDSAGPTSAKSIPERLGYPAGSKLLIIHADDLGVAHSVDRASFLALDQKAVSSASVMVPCPWLSEVAAYARQHPGADLGIHLTLTSEWAPYRWGPVAPKNLVPSLLDSASAGYFWSDSGLAARHARQAEVELELRAQVEQAIRAGIRPTHLDSHMGTLLQTPALFTVFIRVARDYRLPFRAMRIPNAPREMLTVLTDKDIFLDASIMADERLPADKWKEAYAQVLRVLRPGLTELVVHLGYNDAELEAIMAGHSAYGGAWRQRDFEVITSPEFKRLLKETGIIMVGWKDLKKLVQR